MTLTPRNRARLSSGKRALLVDVFSDARIVEHPLTGWSCCVRQLVAMVVAVSLSSLSAESVRAQNTLTAAEKAAGWRLLFDGRSLAGWRGLGYDSVPTAHWKVVDGTIRKIPSGKVALMPDGQPAQGGDLMTVD